MIRARQQCWLTSCRYDEDQASSHRQILGKIDQLNLIQRCIDRLLEWMCHEGRRYQKQQQDES